MKHTAILNNKLHPSVRLNGICPYFTMFPLSFPYKVLTKAKKDDLILDPFCGRGTTNYAARLLGLASWGIDSNPMAYVIAKSKFITADPIEIVEKCKEIIDSTIVYELPKGYFWEWAYHRNTLHSLCKLRQYFLELEDYEPVDIAILAIILGVLHGPLTKGSPSYLSNQMPRTYSTKPAYSVEYWRKKNLLPPEVDVLKVINKRAVYIFNNLVPEACAGNVVFGDSRRVIIEDVKFNWIVTSPPYYGMATYKQDQWLRNWFLGDKECVNYEMISQLKHGSERVFIEDMAKVWKNSARNCTPGARMVIRFGGLPSKSKQSPKDIIRKSIMEADCGWEITTIRSAGVPTSHKRQSNQFIELSRNYIEEFDLYAKLNN